MEQQTGHREKASLQGSKSGILSIAELRENNGVQHFIRDKAREAEPQRFPPPSHRSPSHSGPPSLALPSRPSFGSADCGAEKKALAGAQILTYLPLWSGDLQSSSSGPVVTEPKHELGSGKMTLEGAPVWSRSSKALKSSGSSHCSAAKILSGQNERSLPAESIAPEHMQRTISNASVAANKELWQAANGIESGGFEALLYAHHLQDAESKALDYFKVEAKPTKQPSTFQKPPQKRQKLPPFSSLVAGKEREVPENAMRPRWTSDEDKTLLGLLGTLGTRWSHYKKHFPNWDQKQIKSRCHHIRSVMLKDSAHGSLLEGGSNYESAGGHSQPWNENEDEILAQVIETEGNNWALMSKRLNGTRTVKAIKRHCENLDKKALQDLAIAERFATDKLTSLEQLFLASPQALFKFESAPDLQNAPSDPGLQTATDSDSDSDSDSESMDHRTNE